MKTLSATRFILLATLLIMVFALPSIAHESEDTPLPELGVPVRDEGSRTVTGRFSILWSDNREGESQVHFLITPEDGQAIPLYFGEILPLSYEDLLLLRGQMVTVRVAPVGPSESHDGLAVTGILPTGEAASAPSVLGNQPWVSILCKFADVADEPKPPSYFQAMYSSTYPGLDHYWREQSYGLMNVAGSSATQVWYTLPQPRSYYVYDMTGDGRPDVDFGRLYTDCTTVADPEIYFPAYAGINFMVNAELSGVATGGGAFLALDGVRRYYGTTDEPPWAYSNIAVLAHEMGHAFGFPHSSGSYGLVYDNPWDVMSDTWSNCPRSSDPTFGCLGQHTIAYHKRLAGWIPQDRRIVVPLHDTTTSAIEQLSLPGTSGYLFAEIPIQGSSVDYYMVEVRRRTGYDVALPGEAVIIHEITNGWAHIVDVDGNGDSGDTGAQWLPGETFTDIGAGITVTVDTATTSGFVVSIQNAGGDRPLITVNTTAQKPGAVGDCTLGEAIDAANADAPVDGCQASPGSDRIYLPAGTYLLSTADNDRDGGNGLPVISTRVVLDGAGRDITVIQRAAGAPVFRLFDVVSGGSLLASDVTLSGGEAGGTYGEGGAIYSWNGSLELRSVRVSNNHGGSGGGIVASGPTLLSDCLVDGNTSDRNGGAILYYNRSLFLTRTSFRNNTSGGVGGAVATGGGVKMITIDSSTFINNRQSAIYVNGCQLNIVNSIIRENNGGPAAVCWNCTLNIQDSMLKDNTTGVVVSIANASHINGSCIEGNGGTAVSSTGSPVLDAVNNWWGAANGPSGAGTGSGGAVSSSVNFVPFLTSRPNSCWMAPIGPSGLTSPSHALNKWSNDTTVDVTWIAAIDDGELDGYSILWDHTSVSLPDTTKDVGPVTATTSSALADGDWYFHIRAVDKEGHWAAGAAHLGPFKIDATPPASAAQSPRYSLGAFQVTWAGSDGAAGIATYDIWVRIGTAGVWSPWLAGTTAARASYTGTIGNTYYFRSQARDRAGNVETDLPADGDTLTTVASLGVMGQVLNNRQQPVFNATVTTQPAVLNVPRTDGYGRYVLYLASAGSFDVIAARGGYGTLPALHGLFVDTSMSGIDFVLPPEQDAVVNGGWETGDLTGWEVAPHAVANVDAAAAHTGRAGLRLASPVAASPAPEEPLWQISQTVTLTADLAVPTLSWLYRVEDGVVAGNLVVEVSDGTSAITRTIPLQQSSWTHAWEDLTPLSGQNVTLRIGFLGTAARGVYLDEISIGATRVGVYPVYLPLIARQ